MVRCPLRRGPFVHPRFAERSFVNQQELLAQVAAGKISVDEAAQLLKKAEARDRRSLYCKVSAKGAVSVYGLQRMPVTLYAEQWERLLDFGDVVREFIKENDAQLNRKDRGKDATE